MPLTVPSIEAIRAWVCMAFFATLLLSTGCGSKREVVEVTGTITMEGQPKDLIHVEFWSTNGPRSFGKTDTSGKFELVLDDSSGQKGAVPGEHKVCLRDTWPSKDDYINEGGEWVDKSDGKKSRIDTKYYDAMNSPLSIKIEPGKKNSVEIKIDGPKK
jgi:hypothetical protein